LPHSRSLVAEPLVASALAKDFIDVKIDIDRMKGGADVQARFRRARKPGSRGSRSSTEMAKPSPTAGAARTTSVSCEGRGDLALHRDARGLAQVAHAEDLAAIRKSLVARQAK
jgi:hypothetical protein